MERLDKQTIIKFKEFCDEFIHTLFIRNYHVSGWLRDYIDKILDGVREDKMRKLAKKMGISLEELKKIRDRELEYQKRSD